MGKHTANTDKASGKPVIPGKTKLPRVPASSAAASADEEGYRQLPSSASALALRAYLREVLRPDTRTRTYLINKEGVPISFANEFLSFWKENADDVTCKIHGDNICVWSPRRGMRDCEHPGVLFSTMHGLHMGTFQNGRLHKGRKFECDTFKEVAKTLFKGSNVSLGSPLLRCNISDNFRDRRHDDEHVLEGAHVVNYDGWSYMNRNFGKGTFEDGTFDENGQLMGQGQRSISYHDIDAPHQFEWGTFKAGKLDGWGYRMKDCTWRKPGSYGVFKDGQLTDEWRHLAEDANKIVQSEIKKAELGIDEELNRKFPLEEVEGRELMERVRLRKERKISILYDKERHAGWKQYWKLKDLCRTMSITPLQRQSGAADAARGAPPLQRQPGAADAARGEAVLETTEGIPLCEFLQVKRLPKKLRVLKFTSKRGDDNRPRDPIFMVTGLSAMPELKPRIDALSLNKYKGKERNEDTSVFSAKKQMLRAFRPYDEGMTHAGLQEIWTKCKKLDKRCKRFDYCTLAQLKELVDHPEWKNIEVDSDSE